MTATTQTSRLPTQFSATHWAERKRTEAEQEANALGVDLEIYDADVTAPDPTLDEIEARINVLAGRLMELSDQIRNLEVAERCRPYLFDAEKLRDVVQDFDETREEHDRLDRLWQELKLDSLEFEPEYAFWPDPVDGGMVLVA